MSSFEELAEHCLGINTKGHFLRLYRLEEFGGLFPSLLGSSLFLLPGRFLGVLLLLLCRFRRGGTGFDPFDFFLGYGAFFLEGR